MLGAGNLLALDTDLSAVESAYRSAKSFRLEFEQSIRTVMDDSAFTTTGSMVYLAPGSYRISTPGETICFDGKTLSHYSASINQVEITRDEAAGGFSPHEILTGFQTRFTVAKRENLGGKQMRFSLTPRKDEPFFKSMVLTIDSATHRVMELGYEDLSGTRVNYRFTRETLPANVSEKEFRFVPPRGAKVVDFSTP